MWQQWVNVLLGLWTIAVPFIGLTGGALMWALVVTGVIVALLSLWSLQDTAAPGERLTERYSR